VFLRRAESGTYPLRPVNLIWEVSQFKLLVKFINLLLWDIDLVGFDGRHDEVAKRGVK
jgi:hypothetical protein